MLKPVRQSEAFPGYQFGLNDEEASEAVRLPLDDLPVLDDDGNALFDVSVDQIPSTTRLVTADIVIRLQEARSEEHTSELQSLMRISYAVFCLKKKNTPETTEY